MSTESSGSGRSVSSGTKPVYTGEVVQESSSTESVDSSSQRVVEVASQAIGETLHEPEGEGKTCKWSLIDIFMSV